MSTENPIQTTTLLDSFTQSDYIQSTTYSYFEEKWITRLVNNWYEMFACSLGLMMALLVIYLSLFKKKYINGDYKWFIINQALACLLNSLSFLLNIAVAFVGFGQKKYYDILYSSNCPLWMTLFYEIISLEVLNKFGYYAQMTTLFATVFNRWMALALSKYYSTFMKPRLIFVYCILCYVIVLPNDWRLLNYLELPEVVQNIIVGIYMLVPWLMSVVLNALFFFKLLMHQKRMINVTDQRRLKENRSIILAVFIQTVFPFLDRIPYFVYACGTMYNIFTTEDWVNSWIGPIFFKISDYTEYMRSANTCFIILVAMRPYRLALFSTFSPMKSCWKRFLNPIASNKISVQSFSMNRSPVISVRSVASVSNLGVVVSSS